MSRRELGPASLAVVAAVRGPLEAAAAQRRPVVIGCSGGADSLALSAAVAWALRRSARLDESAPAVRVAIIDHRLQPGSDAVAARAAEQVEALGLDPAVVEVDVVDEGQGPEAAARDARRRVWELLDPAQIWLAHTRDDQAEQVLLGLARGSGPRSLSGMAASDGRTVRPLLELTRQQTRECCTEFGLTPWDDPHNADPRFLRSRVRGELLTELERVLGPGVDAALARSALLCRQDADALDGWAERVLAGAPSGDRLPLELLGGLPIAVGTRVLRGWVHGHAGAATSAVQVQALWSLVADWHGQGPVDLPGGRVVRCGSELVITVSRAAAQRG